MSDTVRLTAFFDNLLRVDRELDENILSPAEYTAAMNGKRHFLDEAIRGGTSLAREHRLAAIVFTDIVAFTSLMAADERSTLEIVGKNTQLHRDAAARNSGVVLKELGDGLLMKFDSVANAVTAAQEIQRAVRSEGGFQVRIGIHLGEIVVVGGDVLGDGVNLAARIQAEAAPGTIAVSEVVADNLRNHSGVAVIPLGERTMKNIAAPMRLFSVST